ncbi:hypothetical protein BUALT_Bualt09G0026800 [Buddleja alternifolia]|uniref:DUF8003 domain-containing protein n=1 Tax=Buddleja alternifolia TaxID=168488 RepID=A0AAV6X3W1_9LAMI|nr:hypothetical protein BUALT_Bualt09G0026800 [Buddleja alternifolia]
MATPLLSLLLFFSFFLFFTPPNSLAFEDFSIIDHDYASELFRGDYSPPSPPPPSPHPPSLSCEDLKGVGTLNTTCELSYSVNFTNDIYIQGKGSIYVLQGVALICPKLGCSIEINITGEFRLNSFAQIVAGSVYIEAGNASLSENSMINVTARAGEPPEPSTGTPDDTNGGGGGHGGRGASCVMDNKKLPEDVWGGDAYSWESLEVPWSFGSKGGTTNKEEDYGGIGGGRIWLLVKDIVDLRGMLLADGGDGGIKGGGGSGGSIYIKSQKMTGSGKICACGGNGFAGGGGGRVSVNVFSRHDEPIFLAHGGKSFGCPENAGAAGTFFDAVPQRLVINNHNMSTTTDTLLLNFPNQPHWTNVDIQNCARAAVPLFWSRVQVRGQLSLSGGAFLSFGLAHYALSEFELLAEELLMSDSIIKAAGDSDPIVATSLLEASNLVVLKVGPGSVLRGPLENASDSHMAPRLYCDQNDCPVELLHPPEDCNVNASLSFTLQICRVEDIIVDGLMEGSVIHFHWVRTVVVQPSGAISASGLGCTGGLGHGELLPNGLSSGAGYGGRGGDAYYGGSYIKGGITYGNAGLPCQLGSGSGNKNLTGTTAGGGVIVMGSLEHSLSKLVVHGEIKADGESYGKYVRWMDGRVISDVGPGGASGGTILLFIHYLVLDDTATISTSGGHGSANGGGGGGGRIHFHWSEISVGDEYMPMAIVKGTIGFRFFMLFSSPFASYDATTEEGLVEVWGEKVKMGLSVEKTVREGSTGYFVSSADAAYFSSDGEYKECPLGTYKNETGSNRALCHDCPSHELPHRAIYTAVRGGITDTPCPYKCISDRYHMPRCYTALEELIYTFGGPWLFGFILLSLLIVLALVLSVARMKFACGDELPGLMPNRRGSPIDRSFPFLESLNEVLETSRTEGSQIHVHRMYFLGANTFSEPWHLPHSPPKEVKEIVYEDAFNMFVDEVNELASYQWWEGSIYSILCVIAYPLSWSWLQSRQKRKVQHLREYVRSEYDHACLRSCRSRALYEGLKVAATSDLMLAYVDFFLGGDQKRDDLPPRLHQRFPMCLLFGGDGSYIAPFALHSDDILTKLMSQSVPPTTWYRLVAGLNAQLRLVRRGHLRSTFYQVINWLETHANRRLCTHGIRVDLARFQPSASGYCQFGLVVCSIENERSHSSVQMPDRSLTHSSAQRPDRPLLNETQSSLPANRWKKALDLVRVSEHVMMQKRISGEILHAKSLQNLKERLTLSYPLYCIIRNIRPVCHQDLVGLIISVLLLGDFSLVLLLLLQLYSISLLDVFLVLSILPLGILIPFPAGINALFSHGPRRSAGFARAYALWNISSVINVVVAFVCGLVHFKTQSSSNKKHANFQNLNFSMDESGWWMLPCGLMVCKMIQARLIDYHSANLEVQDRSLYNTSPEVFWHS